MKLKSNKAFASRVRKTKSGSLLSTGSGRGHFNAKHSRRKKLNQKKLRDVNVSTKVKQRFLLS